MSVSLNPRLPVCHKAQPFSTTRRAVISCAAKPSKTATSAPIAARKELPRREVLLQSAGAAVLLPLASLFTFGATDRPDNLGVQDYGGGSRQLALCPKTKNCVSTSEELNDYTKYIPPWTYNPEEGRGRKGPVSQATAMQELIDTVSNIRPDNFEPKLIEQTEDYVAFEFQSPTFGFIDDLEFLFSKDSLVEYRSASRIGESDGDINRKRIKAIRKELQEKGWKSIGF